MTQTEHSLVQLLEDPEAVMRRVPAMGKVMMIASLPSVTHERIGVLEDVSREGGRISCRGSAHDSSFDPALIRTLVVDRTPNPAGKVYPRIDFNAEDGQTVFSVVGFEGLAPFDAALEGLRAAEIDGTRKGLNFTPRPNASPDDPAAKALDAFRDAGIDITIELQRPGFRQAWTGSVPALKLSMGFVNILIDDFHLHIAGGAVHGWQTERGENGVVLRALDADGTPLGLSIGADREPA